MDPATQTFVTHRNLLFTVAYAMLGSAADAEDVLQETWLRWTDVDLATVREHRASLVRIVTRQALDRLRALSRRKESYIGPWLPEPLLTTPDVADDVELADSVSMAMLLVLETLQPTQRAVFVLHEVFALINGAPGLLVRVNGEIDAVIAVCVENGYVTGAYHVRNPEKLSRMERETAMTRRTLVELPNNR